MTPLEKLLMDIGVGIPANFLDKHRRVLEMRYFDHMTLEEIGKAKSTTRERARQMVDEALEIIKCWKDKK